MAVDTPAAVRALAGACSTQSRALDEQVAGTAPYARGWLVVEQPGPWGRDALRESHLDGDVAAALAERTERLPVRVLLVRRPGRHADLAGVRRVWMAFTEPGRSWLRTTVVSRPADLLRVPLDALAAGEAPSGTLTGDGPVMFVCTNARRDRCCALRGRVLAAAMSGTRPGRVWECSHLGGHRFSPTALVLPYGLVYGRLDETLAAQAFTDALAGRVVLDGYRGRSCYESHAQVAEAHVRRVTGCVDVDALRVVSSTTVASTTAASTTAASTTAAYRVEVAEASGTVWAVTLEQRLRAPQRPESCGKAPAPLWTMDVTNLTRVA